MAQANPVDKLQETLQTGRMRDSSSASFKFNAQAPEFVPRSQTQMPISGYVYPYFQFLGGVGGAACASGSYGSDWFYIGDNEPIQMFSNANVTSPSNHSKKFLTDDLQQKIIKQAEYQFSDMSFLANDSLVKHMNKDPEGFVPISVIANSKKIKSLVSNNHLLVQGLRASSKLICVFFSPKYTYVSITPDMEGELALAMSPCFAMSAYYQKQKIQNDVVVSSDGKKVRRKHLFTDRDKEDLQSRTIVAENLPEDHSHQNLEKIFNVVGSVKAIRICHRQESNSTRSKGDCLISNKLHALVEYETAEIAEKAVEILNDERNWRKGLRVRLLLRCSPKSVLKNRKSEFDGIMEDAEAPFHESSEDSSHPNNLEVVVDRTAEENSGGPRKGWGRGRGKIKGRSQNHSGRGLLAASPQSSSNIQFEAPPKPATKGPRMPDGTRGFIMGRGKPISLPALARLPSK